MAGSWRLLEEGQGTGPWNMGVDEALLRSAVASGLATLRLYSWRGPWLSLGYAQAEPTAEQLRALQEAGVGLVRRPTGGRAVLHGGDLTYAVAAPQDTLNAGLRGTYDQVASALLAALRSLGVAAERVDSRAPAPGRGVFDCFARAAGDEICVAGRKLAGSAQRRSAGAVLQHGSLRVEPDPPRVLAAAGLAGSSATSLREVGCEASEEALRAACIDAFARALRVDLVPGSLAEDEIRGARERSALGPEGPAETLPESDSGGPRGPFPHGESSREGSRSR